MMNEATRRKRAKWAVRLTAALLCLCLGMPAMGGFGPFMATALADATENIVENRRIADPDTMDDYEDRLLTTTSGSRYAGRVWTDKTVFAYQDGNGYSEGHFDGNHTITLSMDHDGYDGNVLFDADFAHVFSALASSQVVDEYPPSPIDMVLVLDISSSMGDNVQPEDAAWQNVIDNSTRTSNSEKLFDYTRLLNLVLSADRIITELMENNPENRVSVVVYDRRAEVAMPLAHYTPNEKTIEELGYYDHGYLGDDGGSSSEPTADKDVGKAIWNLIRNLKYNYICPYFDGHSSDGHIDCYGFGVVATTTDSVTIKDVNTKLSDSGHGDAIARISGTNTHAGVAAGMTQLAEAKDTTLTAELSNGEKTTVPRIPAVIVMTDGGSNTVAYGPWYDPDYDEPVQRSDHKNDWSSVVVAQYLLTTAYLKSAVEKNYQAYMDIKTGQDLPVYTVGVDLRNDNDNWVPARLYPMMDPAKYFKAQADVPQVVPNPNSADGSGNLDLAADTKPDDGRQNEKQNEVLIGQAYDVIYGEDGWVKTEGTNSLPFPLTRWSESHSATEGAFMQNEGDANEYFIPFEFESGVDHAEWHGVPGWSEGTKTEGIFSKPADKDADERGDFLEGTATFEPFSVLEGKTETQLGFGTTNYTKTRTVSYNDDPVNNDGTTSSGEKTRTVVPVVKQDVVDNINYVTRFYDVSSADMTRIFEEILEEVLGEIFVPISGDNDAGVGDSITYQDPIGEYMEIKNQAITATPYHVDGSATHQDDPTTFDMALLVFGEMHGLVRTGVYDFQWNDKRMQSVGGSGSVPLPMGWYKGDDPGEAVYKATLAETGCTNEEDAWANGWVYRLNYSTLASYVPIVDAPDNPNGLSDQAKHTVYTVYRFAGDTDARNALHRNPIYGDVPQELLDEWAKYKGTNNYPADDTDYNNGKYPGVYRLSDIRVWVEDTGDFVDTDGAIAPNAGYDRSLYVNIPAAAVPTELATITLGPDGVLSYKTNLGSDHPTGFPDTDANGNVIPSLPEEQHNAYCRQSTPFRLFYAVGLEEDLILRDADGNQTGVNVSGLSPEYVQSHADTAQNNIYFISNFYSETKYGGYATTGSDDDRGDPTVTFSPSTDNRYYVFQKPLPLYAHAYRASEGTLKPVDDTSRTVWPEEKNLKGGNGNTNWEKDQTGGTWQASQFMGVYKVGDVLTEGSFAYALAHREENGGKLKDCHKTLYPYVEDGIVFLVSDLVDHVTSNDDGSYTGDSIPFSSDDYYFILLEFYTVDTGNTGKDRDGDEVPGTHAGQAVQFAIARKGSEFGSGYTSSEIQTGDMLCWTDMNGHVDVEPPYVSFAKGDKTRGEPTWEKLTKTNSDLRSYLQTTCGITENAVLDEQEAYWEKLQSDPAMKAALVAANGDEGEDLSQLTKDEFEAYFQFALAARPGGIRSGDMSNNVQVKGKNVTQTADNYYLPTISNSSGTDNNIIINNYLGNNGRLAVPNYSLNVTKLVDATGTLAPTFDKDEKFQYQLFINGLEGNFTVTRTLYNEYGDSWERHLAYIDVLTNNYGLLQDNDSNLALFTKGNEAQGRYTENSYVPQRVVQDGTDDAGNPKYFLANEDGSSTGTAYTGGRDDLFYMYLPPNNGGATAGGENIRRIYQTSPDYYSDDFNYENKSDGITTFFAPGTRDESSSERGDANRESYRVATEDRPAGTKTYWVLDAQFIPVGMVDDPEGDAWEFDDPEGVKYSHANVLNLVIRKPNKGSSTTIFTSPYKTRTQYLTMDLNFGLTADQQLYDNTVPASTMFQGITTEYIKQHTAEFTLKSGEGLLLQGLNNQAVYRVTEKLTDDQLGEGYLLNKITHAQQNSTTTETPEASPIADGVYYSVTGNTGPVEEQVNVVNTILLKDLSIEKQVAVAGGAEITQADKDREFTFTLTLTDGSDMPLAGPYDYAIVRDPTGENAIERKGTLLAYVDPAPGETGTDIAANAPGVWTFTLKHGQVMHIVGLPTEASYTYTAEEAAVPGYTASATKNNELAPDEDAENPGYTVKGTVVDADTKEEVVFTNTRQPVALTVTKTVRNGDSSELTPEQMGQEFEFELRLKLPAPADPALTQMTLTGVIESAATEAPPAAASLTEGDPVPDGEPAPLAASAPVEITLTWNSESGEWEGGTFTLKHGETITITGLPEGTEDIPFNLREALSGADVNPYVVSAVVEPTAADGTFENGVVSGKIPAPGSEAAVTEVKVTVYNTMPVPGILSLAKRVQVTIPAGSEYTLIPDQFTFTVRPDAGNPADDPLTALHKDAFDTNGGYWTVGNGAREADGTALTTIIPTTVKYETAGKYVYYVKESHSEIPGISIDPSVFRITVTVSRKDDQMVPEVSVVRLQSESDTTGEPVIPDATATPEPGAAVPADAPVTFTFTNIYDNPITVYIQAHKELKGGTLKENQFTFTLTAGKSSLVDEATGEYLDSPMPKDAAGTEISPAEVKNMDGGTVQFRGIVYNTTGVYNYTLSEKQEENGNIIYDKTVYDVVVDVTKDPATGALSAQVTYNKVENNDTGAAFENTQPTAGAVILAKRMQVTNPAGGTYALKEEDFSFAVWCGDANPADDPLRVLHEAEITADGYWTVTNGAPDEGGTALATVIPEEAEFKTTGTPYVYYVKEFHSNIPGVSIDPSVFRITVNVSLEGDKLVPAVTVEKLNDSEDLTGDGTEIPTATATPAPEGGDTPADAPVMFTFSNVYDRSQITAVIQAHKTLNGGKLTAGDFAFILTAGESTVDGVEGISPMPKDGEGNDLSSVTVTNLDGGTVQFPGIVYNTTGEYHYSLQEQKGENGSIVYDATVYDVTVTVVKEADALKATVTYNEVAYDAQGAAFVNEIFQEKEKKETDPGDGKRVEIGDPVTYSVEWNNYKSEAATVIITDKLDPGADFAVAGIPFPAEGAAAELTLEMKAKPALTEGGYYSITGPVTVGTETIDAEIRYYPLGYKQKTVHDAMGNTVPDPDDPGRPHAVVWILTDAPKNSTGKVQLQTVVNENAARAWGYGTGTDKAAWGREGWENANPGAWPAEDPDQMIYNRAGVKVGNDIEQLTNIPENPVEGKTETAINNRTNISLEMTDDGNVKGESVRNGHTITYRLYWVNDATEKDASDNDIPAAATVKIVDKLDPGVDFVSAAYNGKTLSAKEESGEPYYELPLEEAGPEGKAESYIRYYTAGYPDSGTEEEAIRAHTVEWSLGEQPAGAKGYVDLTVRVNEDAVYKWDYDPDGAYGDNEVNANEPKDDRVVNRGRIVVGNEAGRNTNVVENPTGGPDKEETDPGDGVLVGIGREITYEITWENYLEKAADIVITDKLDPGVDFVIAGYKEGSPTGETPVHDAGTHTVTWTLKEQAAGTSGVVTLTVRVNEKAAEHWDYAEEYDGTDSTKTDGTKEHDLLVRNQAKVQVDNTARVTRKVENPVPEKEEKQPGEGRPVQVGDRIEYEVSVPVPTVDTDGSALKGAVVTVSDPLDKGLTFVEAGYGEVTLKAGAESASGEYTYYPGTRNEVKVPVTVTYDAATRTVKWVIGEKNEEAPEGSRLVPAGEKVTVRLTAEVNGNAPEKWDAEKGEQPGETDNEVNNRARVTVNEATGDTNTVHNPVGGPEKTETAPGTGHAVAVGDEITYEVTWKNYQGTEADVVITDKLDPGVTYVSAGYKEGTPEGAEPEYDAATHTVKWTLEKQAKEASGAVTLTVKVNEKAFYGWSYAETEANPDGWSNLPGEADRTAEDRMVYNRAGVKVGNDAEQLTEIPWNPLDHKTETKVNERTDIELEQNADGTAQTGPKVTEGDRVTYRIYWANDAVKEEENGNQTFTDAEMQVADKLDPGADFVAASYVLEDGTAVTLTQETEADGNGVKTVTDAEGKISISYYPRGGATNAKDNAGAEIKPHTVVWNLGEQKAQAQGYVELTVQVNGSAQYAWSYGEEYGEDGTLNAGERDLVLKNRGRVISGEAAHNTNVVENPTGGPGKRETTPGNGVMVDEGKEIVYEITWENYKEETADIVVRDKLDPGVDYVSAGYREGMPAGEEPEYDAATHTVTWRLKEQAAGATGTVTLTVKVNAKAHYAWSYADSEADVNAAEKDHKVYNRASVQVGNDREIYTEIVENPLPFKEEVTPGEGRTVTVGQEITYEIYWQSNAQNEKGEAVEAEIVITDKLDPGVDFVSAGYKAGTPEGEAAVYDPATHTVTWRIGKQPFKAEGYATLTVRVNEKAKLAWNYSMPNTQPDEEHEDLRVLNQARITVNETEYRTDIVDNPIGGPSKREVTPGDGVMVGIGQEITYEITWENYKDETADIVVRDKLDPGVDYVSAGYKAGGPEGETPEYNAATHTVIWRLKGQAAGAKGTVTLTVKVNADAYYGWSYADPEADVNPNEKDHMVYNRASVQVGNDEEIYTEIVENPLPEKTETKVNGGAAPAESLKPDDKGGLMGPSVEIGDTVEYRISFRNGYDRAAKVTVRDRLDPGVDFVSASCGEVTLTANGEQNVTVENGNVSITYDAETRTVTWTVKEFPADTAGYVTLTVQVNEKAPYTWNPGDTELGTGKDDMVRNRASVQIDDEPEVNTEIVDNPVGEPKTGSLIVTKTVTGEGAEVNKAFTFTVRLSDVSINGTYGDMTFVNGVATFTLKHGESKKAVGLPAGVHYTVIETLAEDEHYTASTVGDTGVIEGGQESLAAFLNTYAPPPEVPKTGDRSHPGFWMGVSLLALLGLVWSVMTGKKRSDR